MSNSLPTHTGRVIDVLPNIQFKVEMPNGKIARCYLAGKMRKFNINVLLGDTVDVVWNESRPDEIGRITRRK